MNRFALTLLAGACAFSLLATAETRAQSTVTGQYKDSNGDTITVYQKGRDVYAAMVSAQGRRHWTYAIGTIYGKNLTLSFRDIGLTLKGVRNGPRSIYWSSNKTSWKRVTPAAAPKDLTDLYCDTNGDVLLLQHQGARIKARMLSPTGKKYWRYASGSISGCTIRMSFPAERNLRANVSKNLVFRWSNGSMWTRIR